MKLYSPKFLLILAVITIAAAGVMSAGAPAQTRPAAKAKVSQFARNARSYRVLPDWKAFDASQLPANPFLPPQPPQSVVGAPASGKEAGRDPAADFKTFLDGRVVNAISRGSEPLVSMGGEVFGLGDIIEFFSKDGKPVKSPGKLRLKQITRDGALVLEIVDTKVEIRLELPADLKDMLIE